MIKYTGKLGDLDIIIEFPGTSLLSKGIVTVMGPKGSDGAQRGYSSKVSRSELLELTEMMRRLL